MGQPEHTATKAQRTYPNRRIHRFLVVFMSAYLAWSVWDIFIPKDTVHESPVSTPNHDNEQFTDWELITPSEELNWFPCFRSVDQYSCTRLTVPMDYNRPLNASSSNPKVHIALLMLPGNHANSGLMSESPLLVNPGGPGGSGTGLVLRAGRAMQTVVGADRDIIGFDPRGIGATTPRADCFTKEGTDGDEGSLMRRLLWQMGTMAGGLPNTSSIATEQVVLRARGVTTLCGTQDGEDSILRYAGTPNVAQDMLSIVQAWDRWTDEMDMRDIMDDELVEVEEPDDGPLSLSTRAKLVYWGFSYGTILGATFATMFPDKVGRMVLDGVANSDEWYFDNVSPNTPSML
jgi:pimeloyl-ACP methyl ester carboxylesterase